MQTEVQLALYIRIRFKWKTKQQIRCANEEKNDQNIKWLRETQLDYVTHT